MIESGPSRYQRFESAIDFLQKFFQRRFTSFDVPTEIASFLRSLKVNYKSNTRNYTIAPTCSVLAQRVLRVVQFRDTDAEGTTTIPGDIVSLIMTALPVENRQQIYRDQAQNSTKYDTYDKLQTRLCIADDEYFRTHPRDSHSQVQKPAPDARSADTSHPSETRSQRYSEVLRGTQVYRITNFDFRFQYIAYLPRDLDSP